LEADLQGRSASETGAALQLLGAELAADPDIVIAAGQPHARRPAGRGWG
jgi:hypothetical protein